MGGRDYNGTVPCGVETRGKINPESVGLLVQAIEQMPEQVGVPIHKRMDPDAIAAAILSVDLLKGLKKQPVLLMGANRCVPEYMGPQLELAMGTGVSLLPMGVLAALAARKIGAVLALDASDGPRLDPDWNTQKPRDVVVVDHHVGGEAYGRFNLVVPGCVATVQILAEAKRLMKASLLSVEEAMVALGIYYDTAGLLADKEGMQAGVSRFNMAIEKATQGGIDVPKIIKTMNTKTGPESQLVEMGERNRKVRDLAGGGSMVVSWLGCAEMQETLGCAQGDLDRATVRVPAMLADQCLELGYRLAVAVLEFPEFTRLSLRSTGDGGAARLFAGLNWETVAKGIQTTGGAHLNAAGMSIYGMDATETVNMVLSVD